MLRFPVKSSSLSDLTETVLTKDKPIHVTRNRKAEPVLEAIETLTADMNSQFKKMREQFTSKFDELKMEMVSRDAVNEIKFEELATKVEDLQKI
ncbi:unnamed protein product [Leptidea sinapis]|uniref:Uncharacterized protein n=1 Tax=Leptidea sinapis TaxID=189913 RepID=A0A5E4R6S7_9NEOP|nr:unnamed protein product [Leptidea sinapis]